MIVRLAILPLTIKQIKSMNALRALQPQIKEIQEKYKDDRQRMNQEMMRFYKENKVNPFASCLPLLLQLPVFMSLFYLLQGHEFKRSGARPRATQASSSSTNITEPAHGAELVVLMVLFIGSQMASTLVMSATADKTQQRIFLLLPLVFAALIPNFPAGLILYWITTNFWTLGPAAGGAPPRRPPPQSPPRRVDGGVPGGAAEAARAAATGAAAAERRRQSTQAAAAAAPQEEAPAALRRLSAARARRGRRAGRRREGASVGAAKWAAMKELERAYPGIDGRARRVRRARGARGRRRGRVRARGARPRTWRPGGRRRRASSGRTSRPSACARSCAGRSPTWACARASTSRRRDEELRANVSGPELGLLIGKHGQTIDALQFLCSQAAYRGGEDRKRVVVDAGGYRERRRGVLSARPTAASRTRCATGARSSSTR